MTTSANLSLTTRQTSFASTGSADKSSGGQTEQRQQGEESKPSGWLDRVFSPSRMHTGNRPHSRLLSNSDFIYEMHYHEAKPEASDDYIKKYEIYSKEIVNKTNNKAELVASFRVQIGNEDEFIHIWRYHDGYKQTSNLQKLIRTDELLVKLNKEQLKYLRKRQLQSMLSFSFYEDPKPQVRNCFYEMRSYVLKPGTVIEWGNAWSKGIHNRDNPVGFFFSQIGQTYITHHIWHYEDLQERKDVREAAWRKPGWDECVAITVPNIVALNVRWMSPNTFSPIR